MAAVLLFESAGLNVMAAEDDVAQNVEIISSEEISGNEVSEETVSDSDVSLGDASDGDVSHSDISRDDISCGDISVGDNTEETVISTSETQTTLFPGLPKGYTLSAEQLEQKAILSQHVGEIAEAEIVNETDVYVTGEVLYLTDSEEEAQLVADAYGAELESYSFGVAVIGLPENRTVIQATLAAADADTLLPAVWPNYYKKLYATPNDPGLYDYNDDYNARYQWMHKSVGSITAWDAGYTGEGIKVAVLDSGIMNDHEEFEGRIAEHWDMKPETPVESTVDIKGHGTHVSGIIAANKGNGKGGAGIAPEASLYVYDISDSKGIISSDAQFRAINKAIEDGIDIMNMSFGSPLYSEQENTIIQKAYDAGIAMFVAAGNDSAEAYAYPASLENVCSVAALQEDGRRSYFSTYNDAVDMAFPGTDVWSAYNESTSAYEYQSGTSQATPIAAGVAAIILSGAEDIPELADKSGSERVDALFDIMEEHAKKSVSEGTGAGCTYLPDVFDLTVDGMDVTPATPTFSHPNKTRFADEAASIVLSSVTTEGVSIYYNVDGKTPSFKNGTVKNGKLYDGVSVLVGEKKSVTIRAIAVNHTTGKSSKVAKATYYFSPNPRTVEVTSAGQVTKLAQGSKLTLKAAVTPDYAVPCKIKWSVYPENQGVTVSSSGKVSVAKDARPTSYRIYAKATDSKGNVFTYMDNEVFGSYQFTVIEQTRKVKTLKADSKSITVNTRQSLNLSKTVTVTYTDKNTENGVLAGLVWTSSNEDVAQVTEGGLMTPMKPGKATLRGTANDGSNKSVSIKVTVTRLATGISVDTDAANLAAGKSVKFTAQIYPSDATIKKVSWTVTPVGEDCTGKVTVNKSGKVTASKNASGKYEVRATTTDGTDYSSAAEIVVVKDSVKKITMIKKKQLYVPAANSGATSSSYMRAEIEGNENACVYESSNPAVASVDAQTGLVSAVASGKAVITCRATDGSNKKAKCTVTVSVPASSVEIVPGDDNNGIVYVGSSIKMSAIVRATYGTPTSRKVKWSVAEKDKDIISISSNGVVKAKSLGYFEDAGWPFASVTIYAEAADGSGIGDTYTITVHKKIKKLDIGPSAEGYGLWATFSDDQQDTILSYDIKAKPQKGHTVGIQKSLFGDFVVVPDGPTTDKVENITKEDGIRVTLTAKPNGSNKKVTEVLYVAMAADGKVHMFE